MGDIGGRRFPLGWSVVPKPCDACKTSASLLFCRTDSTYLCIPCDAKLHGGNIRHERVWMCEVCEQSPAYVTCKADAAALCVTCDRDIHSANPLARRHERIPVVPFYNAAVSMVKSAAAASFNDVPTTPATADEPSSILIGYQGCKKNTCVEEDHEESWLPPINTITDSKIQADIKSIELLLSDEDSLLGFDYPVPINDPRPLYDSAADSVVPAYINMKPLQPAPVMQADQSADNHFVNDFSTSNMSSFNTSYTAQSNVSSAADFGVVPDGSCMSDMSCPFALQKNSNSSNVDLMSGGATNGSGQASQLIGLDREARVMRYREKRKNRKFEKTIRYASRKAYAETRPRIKGRFAKRSDNSNAHDADNWFKATSAAAFMGDSKFGVVPSF